MPHPKSIAFESEEVTLQKLRERLRLMSDEELIKFGKQVRALRMARKARVSLLVTPELLGWELGGHPLPLASAHEPHTWHHFSERVCHHDSRF